MNVLFLAASDTKLGDIALYSLIGFLIVLAVLALLVGIFYLTGFLFGHTALGKEKLFERNKKKKKQESVADETDAASDEELVAAITAAISVVLESENDGVCPEFVIRRVSRKK